MSFDELERHMETEDENLRELGTPEEYEYRKDVEVFINQAYQHRQHIDDKYENVDSHKLADELTKVLAHSKPVNGRYILNSNVVLERDPERVEMLVKFGLNKLHQRASIADNQLTFDDEAYIEAMDAKTLLATARSKTTNSGNVFYGIAFFQTDQDNSVFIHTFCAIDGKIEQPSAKEEVKKSN